MSVAGEKAAWLMEEDVGQNDGLEVDFRGPCTLSKECVWGPLTAQD